MSISDLIKNKFVEEFTAISVGTLLTTLLLSFALGLFVLVIYRVTFGGVSFSASSDPEARVFVRCFVLQTFSSMSSGFALCPMIIPE